MIIVIVFVAFDYVRYKIVCEQLLLVLTIDEALI